MRKFGAITSLTRASSLGRGSFSLGPFGRGAAGPYLIFEPLVAC
jgi:hypothetical protein